MRILVDSSVWVAHFKQRNERLVSLLEASLVVCHPHVIVEIACGTPPNRRALLGLLAALDGTPVATQAEVLQFIETRRLHGRGCGYVDVNLLASALLAEETLVWTLDRRLESLTHDLGRCYHPAH